MGSRLSLCWTIGGVAVSDLWRSGCCYGCLLWYWAGSFVRRWFSCPVKRSFLLTRISLSWRSCCMRASCLTNLRYWFWMKAFSFLNVWFIWGCRSFCWALEFNGYWSDGWSFCWVYAPSCTLECWVVSTRQGCWFSGISFFLFVEISFLKSSGSWLAR